MALLSTPAYASGQLLAEYVDVLEAPVNAYSQSGSSEREREREREACPLSRH
jgi:hypothetical protein